MNSHILRLLMLGTVLIAPRADGAAPICTAGSADDATPAALDQWTATRMWKLTVALDLDPAAASRLFPLMRALDEQTRALSRERLALVTRLQQAIEAKPPRDDELRALVDRMLANDQRRRSLEVERFDSARPLLTLEQQAKLLVLLPRLGPVERFRARRSAASASPRAPEPK